MSSSAGGINKSVSVLGDAGIAVSAGAVVSGGIHASRFVADLYLTPYANALSAGTASEGESSKNTREKILELARNYRETGAGLKQVKRVDVLASMAKILYNTQGTLDVLAGAAAGAASAGVPAVGPVAPPPFVLGATKGRGVKRELGGAALPPPVPAASASASAVASLGLGPTPPTVVDAPTVASALTWPAIKHYVATKGSSLEGLGDSQRTNFARNLVLIVSVDVFKKRTGIEILPELGVDESNAKAQGLDKCFSRSNPTTFSLPESQKILHLIEEKYPHHLDGVVCAAEKVMNCMRTSH